MLFEPRVTKDLHLRRNKQAVEHSNDDLYRVMYIGKGKGKTVPLQVQRIPGS